MIKCLETNAAQMSSFQPETESMGENEHFAQLV